MILEIDSHDWPAFCRRMTEQRAAAMIKLEVIQPDGVKTELVAGGVMQSMTFDGTDPCNDIMVLRIKETREIVHEIIDPIRVQLHPSGKPDDFHKIEIEAENGITVISISPPVHKQMLEGLKLR